MLSRGRLWWIA